MYITASELKAFHMNLSSMQESGDKYLENNIIPRSKMVIDRYCFRNFDSVVKTSTMYKDVQLAQKILAGKLFLREEEAVKSAREAVGPGGGERRGDWSYNLSDDLGLIDDEVKEILTDYVDWGKGARKMPKTGRILLKGDQLYGP